MPLAAAYSSFNVGLTGTLGEFVTGGSDLAHAACRAAAPAGLLKVTDHQQLDCTGAGAGPTVAFNADFSKVLFSLQLNTNVPSPYAPSIQFSLLGYPQLDLKLGLTATSCEYSGHLPDQHSGTGNSCRCGPEAGVQGRR